MPLGFAPWAMNKIVNQEQGELATAKIAARHKLAYVVSTLTNIHPQ